MWGKSITTVTHPPTPHQVIITDTSYLLKDLHSLYNHFTLTFTRANKDPLHLGNIHFQKGPKVPFQGHRTSPGTVAPSVKILENDPACGSILNLIMLYNYTRCASVVENTLTTRNFPQLVEKLLESLTKLTVKDLSPFSSVRHSGTQTHRLRSRPGHHCCAVCYITSIN